MLLKKCDGVKVYDSLFCQGFQGQVERLFVKFGGRQQVENATMLACFGAEGDLERTAYLPRDGIGVMELIMEQLGFGCRSGQKDFYQFFGGWIPEQPAFFPFNGEGGSQAGRSEPGGSLRQLIFRVLDE